MVYNAASSLWCCKYNQFLVLHAGPVQEVKKVEVIEQAVSLVLAEELIHFPTVYSCSNFDINYCFICSSRSRDTVPQSISLELAVKTTCHSHFGQHGSSRFMRSRDQVSYTSLFNLWSIYQLPYASTTSSLPCHHHACMDELCIYNYIRGNHHKTQTR